MAAEIGDKDLNLPARFEIQSYGVSHTGHVRMKNEDSILVNADQSIWTVADGMGGHQAGDFASQTITENLAQFEQQASLDANILLLEENLLRSNAMIRNKSRALGRNSTIGSTVVCVYVWDHYLFTFWAGDSRLYRYRQNKLERLTEDHSFVEELVKMGKIRADEAESHPASNVVLKAIGIEEHLRIDFDYFDMEDGDIYIACSDGLYKDLKETEIAATVGDFSQDMKGLSETLLAFSLDAGGTDNTSIITLMIRSKEDNA